MAYYNTQRRLTRILELDYQLSPLYHARLLRFKVSSMLDYQSMFETAFKGPNRVELLTSSLMEQGDQCSCRCNGQCWPGLLRAFSL